MRAVAIAFALVAAATSQARAECGIPAWTGTWLDSPIPTQGSLYVFQDTTRLDGLTPKLVWHGLGNATAVQISPTVVRIDYSGIHGSELEIQTLWNDPWTYKLDARWQPQVRAPRLIQYWHDASEWTCSYTDALMLQVDQETAAFRVRWTPLGGKPREFIMPARTDTNRSALELGKINCGGEIIPVDELVTGGHVELTAIRLDRSEVPVTGSTGILFLDQLATRSNGLDGAMMLQPRVFRAPVATASTPAPKQPNHSNAVLVLLIIGAGIALAWRTRIRIADSAV